jgi:hypothetical protein
MLTGAINPTIFYKKYGLVFSVRVNAMIASYTHYRTVPGGNDA